jgi:ketosteroid isomerase-like protein
LTRGGRLATLDGSEGIGMGEIDDRTVAGLKAPLARAFEQGDADLAADLYEPGARLLPPRGPVITGPDTVREFIQRRFDAGSDDGVLETVQHHGYGDVAVEEGRYGRRAGDRLLDSGSYLSVFRRQPDGAWRWAIDMWNSDAGES